MEQVFKITIKNTEAAGVEVVPTEEGVEIIVTRREKDVAPRKTGKSNFEILKEFCSEKKTEKKTDQGELKKFYYYYEKLVEEWRGKFMPDKLWERWIKDS